MELKAVEIQVQLLRVCTRVVFLSCVCFLVGRCLELEQVLQALDNPSLRLPLRNAFFPSFFLSFAADWQYSVTRPVLCSSNV